MMRETGNDSPNKVAITITALIYLRGKEEPINQLITLELDPTHLDEGNELESFMQIALRHILATIDVVREHRLILSDERFNKGIWLTEEVQGVTLLAPDEDGLLTILEGSSD